MTTQYTFDQTAANNDMTLVFKKWHAYGVCSVSYWHANKQDKLVEKIVIDIADTDANNKVTSQTKCYVPLWSFMAYLRAEISGTTGIILPKYADISDKGQMVGWASYGGSRTVDGTLVSRVFKSTYWQDSKTKNWDATARAFKCAQFYGLQPNPQAAIQPDYSRKPITNNKIRLLMSDLAEMYERLAAVVYAAKAADNVLELEDNE